MVESKSIFCLVQFSQYILQPVIFNSVSVELNPSNKMQPGSLNSRLLWKHCLDNPLKHVLKNGTTISWNEIGAENGFPVIHFHGAFASRMEAIPQHFSALENNIKLYVLDRPGHGNSTFPTTGTNNYTLDSYSSDIIEWMDHINIKTNQFGISGYSMGGAFAMSQLYYLNCKNMHPKFGILYCGLPFAYLKSSDINTKYRDKNIPKYYNQYMDVGEKYPSLSRLIIAPLHRRMLLGSIDVAFKFSKRDGSLSERDAGIMNNVMPYFDDIDAKTGNKKEMLVKNYLHIGFKEGMKCGIDGGQWGLKMAHNLPFADDKNLGRDSSTFKDIPIDMHCCQDDGFITLDWAKKYMSVCDNDYGLNVKLFEYPNIGHLLFVNTEVFDTAMQRCQGYMN